MKVDEIRGIPLQAPSEFVQSAQEQKAVFYAYTQAVWMREIAAQLAELNENLKALRTDGLSVTVHQP
jgi:hypothetical protein